jgi:hypothetical protein
VNDSLAQICAADEELALEVGRSDVHADVTCEQSAGVVVFGGNSAVGDGLGCLVANGRHHVNSVVYPGAVIVELPDPMLGLDDPFLAGPHADVLAIDPLVFADAEQFQRLIPLDVLNLGGLGSVAKVDVIAGGTIRIDDLALLVHAAETALGLLDDEGVRVVFAGAEIVRLDSAVVAPFVVETIGVPFDGLLEIDHRHLFSLRVNEASSSAIKSTAR